MRPLPTMTIIHTITFGTMLSFNIGNNKRDKTLRVNRP